MLWVLTATVTCLPTFFNAVLLDEIGLMQREGSNRTGIAQFVSGRCALLRSHLWICVCTCKHKSRVLSMVTCYFCLCLRCGPVDVLEEPAETAGLLQNVDPQFLVLFHILAVTCGLSVSPAQK